MDKYLFQIWNVHRTKKVFIVISAALENIYEELILKSSLKMEIDGCLLVLEKNGTVVDDSEILIMVKDEILILLQKNEIWLPVVVIENGHCNTATISTVTVLDKTNSTFLTDNTALQYINEDMTVSNEHNDMETLAIQEYSDNVKTGSVSESTWYKFSVPWNKFPSYIIEDLQKGQQINNVMLNEIVRLLVAEMRTIKTCISQRAIDCIAHKMVAKYPKVFQDVDEDGIIVGSGIFTLAKKIQERNAYLNRSKRKSEGLSPLRSHQKRREVLVARAGCSNWQPPVSSNEIIDIEDKIKFINHEHREVNEDFFKCLKELYPLQREFLSNVENPPSIKDIQVKWPVLLRKEAMFWHYEELMLHSIQNLESSLRDKAEKIIRYGQSKKIKLHEILKNETSEMKAIFTITKLMREDLKIVLHIAAENIEFLDPTPCVVYFSNKDNNNDDEKFFVQMEGTIINKLGDSFIESFKQCFAIFFICGLKYPVKASATWEFIQRYCLKIHPDQGSKSSTFSASKKKVISLMKALSMFK